MNFQSEITDVDDVTKSLNITIPESRVVEQFEVAIKQAISSAQIKGFRPGKAPREMVEKLHGERVKAEVRYNLMTESLREALEDLNLEVVGTPSIESLDYQSDIKFTANIYLLPRPEIKGYEKLKAKIAKPAVGNEDVDKFLENFRERNSTLKKLDFRNKAQMGDVAELTMRLANAPAGDSKKPETMTFELTDATPESKEITSQVVGMEVGESKKVSVTAPKSSEDAPGEGKMEYEVVLNGLFDKVLPELTDDFIKENIEGLQTLLEFRMKIREFLEKEKESEAKGMIAQQNMEILAENNPFNIPQVMIDQEIKRMISRHMNARSEEELEAIDVTPFREKLAEPAIKNVRATIIVDRIAENEAIEATDGDIDKWIDALGQLDDETRGKWRKMLMVEGPMRSNVATEIKRNKVWDLLRERTQVEYI